MFAHIAVMAAEAIEYLDCKKDGLYVDATLGGGGHALKILTHCGTCRVIGMDRDEDGLKAAKETLRPFGDRVCFVKGNFGDLDRVLAGQGAEKVDGVIMDLGVSSHQFDAPERGFSFRFDARLDMRMDRSQETTAYDLVNFEDKDALKRIFRDYGEERFAGKIASAIIRERGKKTIDTTLELQALIDRAVPKRFQARSIHPATRVFQALRIAVNDELGSLERGLRNAVDALRPGGRVVVISFHSLEDRIVKDMFRHMASSCVCPPRSPKCVCGKKAEVRIITKKALTPSEAEIEANPRARSAKMRAAERL